MKKIALLFTLTLFASALNGMEPERSHWQHLPTEVKGLIITAVAQSGDNLDQAIKNIITLSSVNKELNSMINLNDLQGFTKIVHILADKFDKPTTEIAPMFKTATAEKYLKLSTELLNATLYGGLDIEERIAEMKKVFSQGADSNTQYKDHYTLLFKVFREGDAYNVYTTLDRAKKRAQILLEYGAIPDKYTMERLDTYFENFKYFLQTNPQYHAMSEKEFDVEENEIRQMLQKAIQKQSTVTTCAPKS